MASLTRWAWIWLGSGSWWWTGKPGVLQFMGSQRVRHDWATELNWGMSRKAGQKGTTEHVFVIKMYSMLYISYTLIKCGEDGEKEKHLYTNVSMKWCNNLVNNWRSSCKSKCAYMPYSPAAAFLRAVFLKVDITEILGWIVFCVHCAGLSNTFAWHFTLSPCTLNANSVPLQQKILVLSKHTISFSQNLGDSGGLMQPVLVNEPEQKLRVPLLQQEPEKGSTVASSPA